MLRHIHRLLSLSFFMSVVAYAQPDPGFGIWSETLAYPKVQSQLPLLKKYDVDLHLAIHPHQMNDPKLFAVLKEAQRLGVTIYAWPLLSPIEGRWPHMNNVTKVKKMVETLVASFESQSITVPWFSFDMEISLGSVLGGAAQQGSFEERYQKAIDTFNDMIDFLHAHKIKAHAAYLPGIMEDMRSGTLTKQKEYGLPLVGIRWDQLSFLAYTSFFPLVNVETFAQEIKRYFPQNGVMDLGCIGYAGTFPAPFPHQSLGSLIPQINHVKNAGIPRVNVFSLDGLAGTMSGKDPETWLKAMTSAFRN